MGFSIFFVIGAVFIVCVVTIIIIIVFIHSCGDVMCIEFIVVYFLSAHVSVSEYEIFIVILLVCHVFHFIYYILWHG